jgi:phosphoribosylaminoimidazole (AIR) synthetase
MKPRQIFQEIRSKEHLSDLQVCRAINLGIEFFVICPKANANQLKGLLGKLEEIGRLDSFRKAVV